ncbi:group 3 secretory phospholipase A2 isoform X3 [Athalia rosae]|uniref:group 3 secretory phospholipase A2 isoform X3 n=1 Tax=Athalia rosae TaxID=37344 RepID=UPI00203375B8|nr:group 3 secretory phospholipase A2 isoform X3 [Athalia rosae]
MYTHTYIAYAIQEIDVTLREVWLQRENRKLQLIYEGGILSDCFDEKITDRGSDDDSAEECRVKMPPQEERKGEGAGAESPSADSSAFGGIGDWFASADDLRRRCSRIRTRVRNQVLARRKISACGWNESRRRPRRSRSGRRRRDLLLIPGTQWCGRGHRATKYTNLGGFGVADACCRRHDTTCPFFIPAFQSKYELFNWGVSTIMHCACDERFRTCLKMAGTSSANFVGKLFFNVVQTKCFVLKPQKACLRRSRWGNCEQHEYRKQARLRSNMPY